VGLLDALDDGRPALGLWVSDPEFVEVAAHVGFDWFLVDQMFSANDWIRAGAAAGATPIVRIQSNPWLGYDHRISVDVSRVLGIGAPFAFVSYSGRDELLECIRATGDWHRKPLTVHPWDVGRAAEAVRSPRPLIPMVESEGALDSLEEAIAHPEIDFLFFAMTDAARVLAGGAESEWGSPEVWEYVDRAVELGGRHGVAIGANTGFAPTLSEVAERTRLLHEHGIRIIMAQGAPFLFQIAAEELMLQLTPTIGGAQG
jgi:4-hydroxy-2-oxoheptanedioate aldolase